ncbi:hypothetical protein FIBSPDRAFT_887192 [Athelia psychrophila]|uniref:Uncharacterized protein n=1 Tax=Athelia psychrophila TaxID=1759441 RepID=A0A166Q331_9AGAM|nr:hypothetical protein FIBSPDRAFT_887192 [Fibularhizoctonia sp. CBS 109695]
MAIQVIRHRREKITVTIVKLQITRSKQQGLLQKIAEKIRRKLKKPVRNMSTIHNPAVLKSNEEEGSATHTKDDQTPSNPIPKKDNRKNETQEDWVCHTKAKTVTPHPTGLPPGNPVQIVPRTSGPPLLSTSYHERPVFRLPLCPSRTVTDRSSIYPLFPVTPHPTGLPS